MGSEVVTHPAQSSTSNTVEATMASASSQPIFLISKIKSHQLVRPFDISRDGRSAKFVVKVDMAGFEEGVYTAMPFYEDSTGKTGHTISSIMFKVNNDTKEFSFNVKWEAVKKGQYMDFDGKVYESCGDPVEGGSLYHDSVFG